MSSIAVSNEIGFEEKIKFHDASNSVSQNPFQGPVVNEQESFKLAQAKMVEEVFEKNEFYSGDEIAQMLSDEFGLALDD